MNPVRPFRTVNQPLDHVTPDAPYQAECDKLSRPAVIFGLWHAEFEVNNFTMSFGLYEKALDFYDEYVSLGRHNEGRIFMRLVQGASDTARTRRHG